LSRPDYLRACLNSVVGGIGPLDEVLVGLSPDDLPSHAVVAEQPEAKGVVCGVLGVIAKMNLLALNATNPVCALIDDDAEASDGWLDGIREAFRDDSVGCFGGRDVLTREVAPYLTPDVGKISWSGRILGNHHLGTGGARDVAFLKGVNLACRTSLFPISTFMCDVGAEPHWEMDLCFRATQAGLRVVYDPAHIVLHHAAARAAGADRDADVALARVSARNEWLALAALPARQRIAARLHTVLVGGNPTFGLARAVVGLLRREPRGRLSAANRGRLDAVKVRWHAKHFSR
jgi:hypothetical protein